MSTALRMTVPAGGRLTVDLRALASNWRRLADRSGPAECGAAVKADAYGLGVERCAGALVAAGCRSFFVAQPSEGVKLRSVAASATIYVLNGYTSGAAPIYFAHRLRPVLGSSEEIASWLGETGEAGEPAALHVDTGMNRLGLDLAEAAAIATDDGLLSRLRPALLMTHLACADTWTNPMNANQIRRFAEVRALFPSVAGSLANSAALMEGGREIRQDLTRPGIALYGGRWSAASNPLETVARVEARVIQIRDVAAGECVGYGATFVAGRPSRIAILSAGYADGLHRAAAGQEVAIGGRRVPIVGRISMDLTAVDVTDLETGAVQRGDFAEVFGTVIPLDEVANRVGTIGYEILTSIGRRYERRYLD